MQWFGDTPNKYKAKHRGSYLLSIIIIQFKTGLSRAICKRDDDRMMVLNSTFIASGVACACQANGSYFHGTIVYIFSG